MAGGYFNDGTIHVELGAHAFATPTALRRNVFLEPHSAPATVLDSGGGVLELTVTGQRLRANLGDAERYAYEHFHSLATSDPGDLGVEDNLGNRAVFGDSVCIGAVAEIQAFRFVEMRTDWQSPSKSAEPAWGAIPAAPATYPGTDTLQDYRAGGVQLGTFPVGMRIEMSRRFPLREIPRARGSRARGPAAGAVIRFVVTGHALVTGQNLADYLEALARSIGPRWVTLRANGNVFDRVLLESLRPTHTDSRATDFEAEFVQDVELGGVEQITTTTETATTTGA